MILILVLIGGGTCSGKTTLAKKVQLTFPTRCVVISLDSYYRDQSNLSFEERSALNFDHPDAFEWDLILRHVATLLEGSPVDLPVYDFAFHARKPKPIRVFPRPIIVLEGILALYNKELNSRASLRVFVDLDPILRLERRRIRDCQERGRDEQLILTQYYDSVFPMHVQFVESSRHVASLVVSGAGEEGAKAIIQRIERLIGQVR